MSIPSNKKIILGIDIFVNDCLSDNSFINDCLLNNNDIIMSYISFGYLEEMLQRPMYKKYNFNRAMKLYSILFDVRDIRGYAHNCSNMIENHVIYLAGQMNVDYIIYDKSICFRGMRNVGNIKVRHISEF